MINNRVTLGSIYRKAKKIGSTTSTMQIGAKTDKSFTGQSAYGFVRTGQRDGQ